MMMASARTPHWLGRWFLAGALLVVMTYLWALFAVYRVGRDICRFAQPPETAILTEAVPTEAVDVLFPIGVKCVWPTRDGTVSETIFNLVVSSVASIGLLSMAVAALWYAWYLFKGPRRSDA
jgi:hypothetical protein